MPRHPFLSLIVPTRHRLAKLQRLLGSLAETTADPGRIEIILVMDADDPDSLALQFSSVGWKRVVVPPGLSMGALNQAGFAAAAGNHLMLLNDDVIVRTRNWDKKIAAALHRFPDGIVLVHVNDTLFQDGMCTFPLVSRTYCDLAGGICPPDYLRYRIDDHVEQVFNLLGALGENRIVYLPNVVFEHDKYVTTANGQRQYFLDKGIEARDALRFAALFPARKELALKLKSRIPSEMDNPEWRCRLDAIEDTPALRSSGRLPWQSFSQRCNHHLNITMNRLRNRFKEHGYTGLARAIGKRLGVCR